MGTIWSGPALREARPWVAPIVHDASVTKPAGRHAITPPLTLLVWAPVHGALAEVTASEQVARNPSRGWARAGQPRGIDTRYHAAGASAMEVQAIGCARVVRVVAPVKN